MNKFLPMAFFVTALGAGHAAFPAEDNDWYLLSNGLFCEPHDPRQLIAISKMAGFTLYMKDVKEAGKVVATTITALDGSTAEYYRGKTRCEQALKRHMDELDRYK